MLYDPLSHLSGLYGAATDSLKSQPLYPELVGLGDSVLRCLGQAYQWDESHGDLTKLKTFAQNSKQFIVRLEKVHKSLNVWVDERQYVSLIAAFELRWEDLLKQAEVGKDETLERLINESEYRRDRLAKLLADINAEDEELKNRYGIPTAL